MITKNTISHDEAVTSTYWGGKKVLLPQEYKIFFSEVFQIADLTTRIDEVKILKKYKRAEYLKLLFNN